MWTESAVLKLSIACTVLLAVFGIVSGLLSGSFSIVFDGFYSLIDALMSGLALAVTSLIGRHTGSGAASRKLGERFNMGFWHLEPMVLMLNGTLLCAVSLYALINAIGSLLDGGQTLHFDYAVFYAMVAVAVCTGMTLYAHKANQTLRSDFIALDVKTWIMSGSISAALLVAFAIGLLLEDTPWAWLLPYIDPAVLAVICACLVPLPLKTLHRAFSDVLMLTPADLKQQVDTIAARVVAEEGFIGHQTYVAKVGRARQIEIYFIVPGGWPAQTLEQWDTLRDRIGEAIGGDDANRWLTIAFTTDPAWAQ
ncbi:cation diffusion facilitator family transporter [Pseudomonas monteilii]|uniref:cation diffusion facilitator family transporter n=1 Tax=Pseudomonas alabamensis TaxID=3064349 RepID=UPI000745E519|nr:MULTISPECIES: cation transporter [Pseudomonas]AMA45677.1 cation diffusion facilitator family transporter [Pseudomonas monteilii]MDO7910484.1 cation transporter [Pseudomonas sp. 22-AL-CL-001]